MKFLAAAACFEWFLLLRSGQLDSHSTHNCSSFTAVVVGQRGVVAAGLSVSLFLIVVFHIQNWWLDEMTLDL